MLKDEKGIVKQLKQSFDKQFPSQRKTKAPPPLAMDEVAHYVEGLHDSPKTTARSKSKGKGKGMTPREGKW